MKTKRIIERLLCFALASIFMFCLSFSGAATELEIEDIETINNDIDIEIEDLEPINNDIVDADDFILDGQISSYSGDADASTLAISSDTHTEDEMTINLSGLTNTDTDFKTLFTYDELLLDSDPEGYYFGMQGGCTDGVYNYFAFIVKNSSKVNVDTRIVCDKIEKDENYDGPYWTVGLMDDLQHINDMTYNSITGEIVIACCEKGYYQQIYTIDATELQNNTSQRNFQRHDVSCMVTSIGFNETRNQYVVGLSGQLNSFAILDCDFNLIKSDGYDDAMDDDNWAGQGLHCDNKYIYLTQFLNVEKSDGSFRSQTTADESRVKIFDWNGEYIKTIKLTVNKAIEGKTTSEERYYEVENMYVTDDQVLLGFNCMHTPYDRMFTYIDISDYTYHIQYCPDENVENYIERTVDGVKAKDNNNVKSVMIKGISTHLYRSRLAITGKKFAGWTAYRAETDKWLYKDTREDEPRPNGWYVEGQQPEGYVKYVYTDTQQVANTGVGGDHVLMCAQWEDTSEFTVRFFSNGGTEEMADLRVIYGTATPLSNNTFTKTKNNIEYVFQGWNAYWPEKNKWYYRSEDGTSRGWYTEGCEPSGYRKYKYSNQQSVVKTVYAGSNVYMYAVWDEFYVYYNANGVEVAANGIKERGAAKYGGNNDIKLYDASDLYKVVSKTGEILYGPYVNYEFEGYYQYWVEEDKWMCVNEAGETIGWYSQADIDLNGYEKYVRKPSSHISKTVNIGEHLVLYAKWNY